MNANGGTLTAGAANVFSHTLPVTVSNGGLLDVTAGSQTIQSLTINALSTLNISTSYALTLTGQANLNGTINVTGPVVSGGTIDLMNYGSYTGSQFSNPFFPFSSLVYLPKELELITNAGPSIWQVGSGSWNTAGNWASNAVPDSVGAQAIVGTGTTTPVTITLDTAQTVGQLTLQNSLTSSTGYTLAAGVNGMLVMQNAVLNGTSQIAVTSGVHAITANMEIWAEV